MGDPNDSTAEEIFAEILDPDRRGALYPHYHRLRERAPVLEDETLLGRRAWILTRFEDADRVLRDPVLHSDTSAIELFDTGPSGRTFFEVMRKLLLYLDPPEHDRIRGLVSKAFTPRAVDARKPRIQTEVDRLLDRVEDAGKAELVADFGYPLPIAVICEMMGIPESDRATFLTWAHDFARRGDVSGLTENVVARGEVASAGFRDYFLDLARSRRKALGDDLISALVEVEDETGRLSDAEVVSTCVILLQAGHETTADLISMAIRGLILHPDQLALLREAPARVVTAADEFIRWDTSVQISQRVGSRDIEVGGRRIPAGDVCVVMNGAANRDPGRFPDPDRLDIARATPSHLGFGMGRHFCLGASLARAEIAAAVGTFITRFPRFDFAEEPAFRPSLFLRGLARLPLSLG
ncbi:MAG: cytochrome P450 [bacterium]|nr:cytochrome P450 [bacterium]